MDRLCPKCGQRYRADVAICPVHRVALVDDPFIGRALGDYDIVGYLGQGAMGVVYRADPPAAVKILNVVRARMQPELVRRFELEAKAIARLESPHIVRLYDAGTTGDGHLYITMELLRGQTLDDLIRARRTLGPERSADIVFQAASALGEAHDKWVVHRDVKPDNLFLEPAEGRRDFVRVLDFGVVRINSDSVARSITGTVAGTPAYMSPEQLKSEKDIDGRTDIYSLGVVLYQGLAGRNPFQGEGLMQTIQRHLYEPVPPLPAEVPPPLAELTLRMLAKAREDRPQSMAEVQGALVAMGLAPHPPVRLAGPVGVDRDPDARDRTLAALATDPAFQRARQITPVARPVDPPTFDGLSSGALSPGGLTLDSADDPFAPIGVPAMGLGAAPGGSFIEPGPGSPGHASAARAGQRQAARARSLETAPDHRPSMPPGAGDRADDPFRASSPPADRPSIDIPLARMPTDRPPGPLPLAEAPDLDPERAVDPPTPVPGPAERTWAGPGFELPGEGDSTRSTVAHARRERRRVVFTGLIFALGAATGVVFSAGVFDAPPASSPPGVGRPATPEAHRLRGDIRRALDREEWAAASRAAEQLVALRPEDPQARALLDEAAAEAAAAEIWTELLDRIADEQWQAAASRAASFPAGSVYRPRVDGLIGLIDEGRAEARLEAGLTAALHGDWAGAEAAYRALAEAPHAPQRLPILDQAIRRRRFKPTPYTEHLLEARARMNAGDYVLALTRLRQAAEDLDAPDRVISRRMCTCLRALGEFDGALPHARRWGALERDPRYGPVIAHTIARLEARAGR